MHLTRLATTTPLLLLLALSGQALAAVAEPSAKTLCDAIGSEISVPGASAQASAVKPRGRATAPAKSASPPPRAAASSAVRGGGDATVQSRGRWKSFIPGTFK